MESVSHCVKCDRPDSADNLVGCDSCSAWVHYGCAGVNDSIANADRSYKCDNCRDDVVGRHSEISSSVSSRSKRVELTIKLMEERRNWRLKQQEEEDVIRQKRIAEEDEIRKQRVAADEKFLKEKAELLLAAVEDEDESVSSTSRMSSRVSHRIVQQWLVAQEQNPSTLTSSNVVPPMLRNGVTQHPEVRVTAPSTSTIQPTQSKVQQCESRMMDFSNPIASSSTTYPLFGTARLPEVNHSSSPSTFYSMWDSSYGSTVQCAEGISSPPIVSSREERRGSFPMMPSIPQVVQGPSPAQLAARQVVSRELPPFTGDPLEWPLFFSSYRNSTDTCGFTNAENLSRLQRCLKGQALESVKGRLLMPESVPSVLETLNLLYGRPEILLHSVLQQVRAVPPPKSDNLSSIITYGLAVQNAVDHMIMTNLHEHLNNPMLLHELVEKLPALLKLEWSGYKRARSNVNLTVFREFMTELVRKASDVTIPDVTAGFETKVKGRDKQRLYIHTESSSSDTVYLQDHEPAEREVCYYCSKLNHQIVDCQDFNALDIDGRWKAIKLKGLCRSCLIPHRKWPCRSGKQCGVQGCRIHHHKLLHNQYGSHI